MSWEEIRTTLEEDTRLKELIFYFRGDSYPNFPVDVVMWLYPDLRKLSPPDARSLHDWIDRRDKVEKPANHPTLSRMLRLLDDIADGNSVEDQPSQYVASSVRTVLGPFFNENAEECLKNLKHFQNHCRHPYLRVLVNGLIKHYEDVLAFGNELEEANEE